MRETWLRPNRRAILFGAVTPMLVATGGLWLAFRGTDSDASAWHWGGIVLLVLGLACTAQLLLQLRRPRIAFENGTLLFYLRSGSPIGVPVDVVEAFFAGQGPAHLPGLAKQPQTANLMARISQRHTEWATQAVKPALGNWAEGYVTIRGAWCEPLTGETIRKLNRRLKEVKDAAAGDAR
jgi:hypothetical protein